MDFLRAAHRARRREADARHFAVSVDWRRFLATAVEASPLGPSVRCIDVWLTGRSARVERSDSGVNLPPQLLAPSGKELARGGAAPFFFGGVEYREGKKKEQNNCSTLLACGGVFRRLTPLAGAGSRGSRVRWSSASGRRRRGTPTWGRPSLSGRRSDSVDCPLRVNKRCDA